MALPAHGYTFDKIFSARYVGCGDGPFTGMLREGGCVAGTLCIHGLAVNRNRACGKEPKSQSWSDGEERLSTEGTSFMGSV
jgi:hypothetical protein